mgnify:CR=1 FL=1
MGSYLCTSRLFLFNGRLYYYEEWRGSQGESAAVRYALGGDGFVEGFLPDFVPGVPLVLQRGLYEHQVRDAAMLALKRLGSASSLEELVLDAARDGELIYPSGELFLRIDEYVYWRRLPEEFRSCATIADLVDRARARYSTLRYLRRVFDIGGEVDTEYVISLTGDAGGYMAYRLRVLCPEFALLELLDRKEVRYRYIPLDTLSAATIYPGRTVLRYRDGRSVELELVEKVDLSYVLDFTEKFRRMPLVVY